MACGTTVAQNNTYHIITTFNTASDPSPCTYKICPCSNNICKIRLDFEVASLKVFNEHFFFISLEPDCVNFRYFQLRLFDIPEFLI